MKAKRKYTRLTSDHINYTFNQVSIENPPPPLLLSP